MWEDFDSCNSESFLEIDVDVFYNHDTCRNCQGRLRRIIAEANDHLRDVMIELIPPKKFTKITRKYWNFTQEHYNVYNYLHREGKKPLNLLFVKGNMPGLTPGWAKGMMCSNGNVRLASIKLWNRKGNGKRMAHEIGHILGACHVYDEFDVMSVGYGDREIRFCGTRELVHDFVKANCKPFVRQCKIRSEAVSPNHEFAA